jgi:hypothetical protein
VKKPKWLHWPGRQQTPSDTKADSLKRTRQHTDQKLRQEAQKEEQRQEAEKDQKEKKEQKEKTANSDKQR